MSDFKDRVLVWEDGGTDEPGDQNASSQLVDHGYWSLGPRGDGTWGVELIERDELLQEVRGGGIHLGRFDSEDAAKRAANDYERREAARREVDEKLSSARQRLIAAEREVDSAVRAVVRDRVRNVYPEAQTLIAEGEWNEEGLLHLHARKVLSADGTVLDGYDEEYGTSLSADWDELTDEIDALLDEIAERDEGYQGTHEFDLKEH